MNQRKGVVTSLDGISGSLIQTSLSGVCNSKGRLRFRMTMMMMNFIHVSMYLADANWGHNIKIK